MKHIAGWFRRNNTIMAQAKDLSRQLQEAWAENALLTFANETLIANAENMVDQLHRVARERFSERAHRLTIEQQYSNLQDEYLRLQQITVASVEDCHVEREKRLEAEDRLLDYHLDGPTEEELGDWKAAYYNICDQLNRVTRERFQERKLRLAAEKLRDVYLEQLENEEE